MAKAKKFGAFSGVFTPSVLTILGVIMYMRLGWVVGNAGLIGALIIIVISHVISVTTGLSISSVATDKKIKTGGIYYILSRSLGFPMGGAIGIALFIGTALGISLYLVGFAESLLAVDQVREFLHLNQDINSYRIAASASLIILVTIAFISTSLAIKSQYFVLAAIAVSLVSIVIGFFTNTHFAPETISYTAARESVDIQVVFGVFFPAVTGFTAGVAMSGDLRNPRKNIPFGTMSAIIVGFVIYIVLAVSFAVFVNRDLLIEDYNFLLKIAWFSPLVLAGIWGATLSSALGGILGGPRILQAISKDKITPKIFAKGYGASNEPRNALIFIFLIAEGGILIGELNVIAGVVSMFYLASYGFINLAFFLENWASTDFRPSFKVKGIIGLIGFIASFAVMAQLGMMSMIAALVIMFGLFAWLNRKKLKSESGDVWQSVWLSVVRKALHSLDKKNLEERNWQPNIILFSGGQGQRPHLIEFGKDLVGQYGLLSNFDLHESKNKNYLFPKHLQSQSQESFEGKGVFTRRQTCSDIYTGIETIISTYGFSGIEPNTILLGWMRQSKDPIRFSQMIQRIYELDVNILLIDYDKRFGYGKYKTVDIWWRGSGNNGNLALNLMKFLWVSENWSDAKLRLLIGNPVNENATKIRNQAEQVISNMRIDAEIKIINNQIEQKPFYELIRTESINTDLIILGMPEIKKGKEIEFVEKTSLLMHQIGTVVLIKASSQFKDLNLGLKYKPDVSGENGNFSSILSENNEINNLILPANPIADEMIKSLNQKISSLNSNIIQNELIHFFSLPNKLIESIIDESELILQERIIKLKTDDPILTDKNLITGLNKLIKKTQYLVKDYKSENILIQEEYLTKAFEEYIVTMEKIYNSSQDHYFYSFNEDDLRFKETDDKKLRNFKKKVRLKNKLQSKPTKYKVKYKKLLNKYIPHKNYLLIENAGKKIGSINIQFILELQRLIRNVRNSILKLQIAIRDDKFSKDKLKDEERLIKSELKSVKKLKDESSKLIFEFIQNKSVEIINSLSADLKMINSNKSLSGHTSSVKVDDITKKIQKIPKYFIRNQELLLNSWDLELRIIEFENQLYRITEKSMLAFVELINIEVLDKVLLIKSSLESFLNEYKENHSAEYTSFDISEIPDKDEIFRSLKSILNLKFEKLKYLIDRFPEKSLLLSNDSFNDIIDLQFDDVETVEISISGFIDYLTETEFNTPLIKIAEYIPEEITKIENSAQNILRRVLFSLFDDEGKIIRTEENTPKKVVMFINEQINSLNKLEEDTLLIIETINRRINERLSDISNKLSVYSLINQASTYKRFSKRSSKKTREKKIIVAINNFRNFFINQFNQIWYRQSDAALLRLNLKERSNEVISSKVKESLNLIDNVSVSKELMQKLPFYYQQLFLRPGNFNKKFFFGRNQELQQIQNAFKRYQSGYHGAIMITGERYSGKTFFAHYSISEYLPDAKIFAVNPPPEGSMNKKTFKTKLALSLNVSGNYSDKFSSIPAGSIIYFDDLELWWEKSESGLDVVKELIQLIEDFGNKILFIVNINSYALKLINRIINLESYFLDIIECKPVNAKQLKEAVIFRHNSAGLRFNFKNKTQDNLRQSDYAELFAKYFNYSDGNIGITLISWLTNIRDFKDNIIFIDSVSQNKESTFNNNDSEINLILVQFMLHKRLTISKLSRINMLDESHVEKQIVFLKRSGIIVEDIKSVYEINKYLYIHIKHHLQKMDLI